ncbi:MAG: hypothetical protein FWG94_02010 [Oscillospiraceae bacterium]|nr:hypothetical protein [Oscillospiraceae bacterium]
MTVYELGKELKAMYETAPNGEATLMIRLFGIKYADVINSNDYTAVEIVKASGIKDSYHTEVSKGIKLARYVKLK